MTNESFTQKISSALETLEIQDFSIINDFIEEQEIQKIVSFFEQEWNLGNFHSAGIGADINQKLDTEIRNDSIRWIEKNEQKNDIFSPFFTKIDELKDNFTQYFRVSLSDYEFHLARYDAGHFYKKHLDQFSSRSNRILSAILYLNSNWKEENGGALRVYKKDNSIEDILPLAGRLVLMRSDIIWHEVLPSNKTRISLTGWLTKKPLGLGNL
ncbi:MAG: 2OG-Fe(II) oxygenase [Flavobacteriales bacterium]|nr:2OG-Fe(II) oxygenase [Flavobacteriales bacterium]